MKGHWVVVGSLILALVVGVTGAVAAESKSFGLMGQKDTPQASGTATVEGTKLTITAKGLKAQCRVHRLARQHAADHDQGRRRHPTL